MVLLVRATLPRRDVPAGMLFTIELKEPVQFLQVEFAGLRPFRDAVQAVLKPTNRAGAANDFTRSMAYGFWAAYDLHFRPSSQDFLF